MGEINIRMAEELKKKVKKKEPRDTMKAFSISFELQPIHAREVQLFYCTRKWVHFLRSLGESEMKDAKRRGDVDP